MACLQLSALPSVVVVSKRVVGVVCAGTDPFSKCWLTVRSFVPSSGLMSFQGVGFSFVQTTTECQLRDC